MSRKRQRSMTGKRLGFRSGKGENEDQGEDEPARLS